MSPTSRVADFGLSPIRRMAVGAPAGTISLGLGEPGWPLPQVARDALTAAGRTDGPLPYGPNTSSPELVDEVRRRYAATNRIPSVASSPAGEGAPGTGPTGDPAVAAEQVMVTSGSQAALCALFLTHVEAGSTVLVPDPGFVSYGSLALLCQARSVGYRLGPGGVLDAARVVEALDAHPGTSLVVLNHPSNPTGACAAPEELAAVAAACAERGVLLVSDEVYADLWVPGGTGTTAATGPDVGRRDAIEAGAGRPASLHDVAGLDSGIVLGSVSKAFGAPGLRVGWAVGPAEVLAPARVVHNAMTTAPARPSQDAAAALLRAADEVLPAARREVALRWETLARCAPQLLELADRAAGRPTGGRGADTPRAGFYLWLPVPEGVDPADTEAFALRVRDESLVTTVPGSAFGPAGAGHLRVSLGGPIPELEEGLARLAPWWEA